MFDSDKLTNFSCAPDGVRTQVTYVIESQVLTLYQLSHPVPPVFILLLVDLVFCDQDFQIYTTFVKVNLLVLVFENGMKMLSLICGRVLVVKQTLYT